MKYNKNSLILMLILLVGCSSSPIISYGNNVLDKNIIIQTVLANDKELQLKIKFIVEDNDKTKGCVAIYLEGEQYKYFYTKTEKDDKFTLSPKKNLSAENLKCENSYPSIKYPVDFIKYSNPWFLKDKIKIKLVHNDNNWTLETVNTLREAFHLISKKAKDMGGLNFLLITELKQHQIYIEDGKNKIFLNGFSESNKELNTKLKSAPAPDSPSDNNIKFILKKYNEKLSWNKADYKTNIELFAVNKDNKSKEKCELKEVSDDFLISANCPFSTRYHIIKTTGFKEYSITSEGTFLVNYDDLNKPHIASFKIFDGSRYIDTKDININNFNIKLKQNIPDNCSYYIATSKDLVKNSNDQKLSLKKEENCEKEIEVFDWPDSIDLGSICHKKQGPSDEKKIIICPLDKDILLTWKSIFHDELKQGKFPDSIKIENVNVELTFATSNPGNIELKQTKGTVKSCSNKIPVFIEKIQLCNNADNCLFAHQFENGKINFKLDNFSGETLPTHIKLSGNTLHLPYQDSFESKLILIDNGKININKDNLNLTSVDYNKITLTANDFDFSELPDELKNRNSKVIIAFHNECPDGNNPKMFSQEERRAIDDYIANKDSKITLNTCKQYTQLYQYSNADKSASYIPVTECVNIEQKPIKLLPNASYKNQKKYKKLIIVLALLDDIKQKKLLIVEQLHRVFTKYKNIPIYLYTSQQGGLSLELSPSENNNFLFEGIEFSGSILTPIANFKHINNVFELEDIAGILYITGKIDNKPKSGDESLSAVDSWASNEPRIPLRVITTDDNQDCNFWTKIAHATSCKPMDELNVTLDKFIKDSTKTK